jgi:hypothetical protein
MTDKAVENFIRSYNMPEEDLYCCDEVVEWFNKEEGKKGHAGLTLYATGEEAINNEVKESKDISLNFRSICHEPPFIKPFNFLWSCVQKYIQEFVEVDGAEFTIEDFFNVQKYYPPTGGYKAYHCERISKHTQNRCLVWMMYLNTVEKEGGTEFKYYNHIEKAEKGKVVLWPTDFTHTHRGLVAPEEEKIIMTGWYVFL